MALNSNVDSFLVPAQFGNYYNIYYSRVTGGSTGCVININNVIVNVSKNSIIDILMSTVSGGTGCYLSGERPDVYGDKNEPFLSPLVNSFKSLVLRDNGFFVSETCLLTTLDKLNNI